MKNFIILFFTLSTSGFIFGQNNEYNSSKNFFIESNAHIGKIINNYLNSDSFPPRKMAFLYEMRLGKQTNGSKDWMQIYKLPDVAISLVFGQLGNNQELGQNIGIVPNVTFNTINQKKFSLKFNIGIGFAWFNKPFNSKTNTHNILIGSRITNMSFFKMYLNHNLSEKWNFLYGASVFHCSNGHYQVPNAGLNLPTMYIGLSWHPNGKPFIYPSYKVEPKKGSIKLNFFGGVGVHEFAYTLGPTGGPKYKIYDGEIYLSKRMGKFSNVLVGIDYKYYSNFYDYILENSIFEDNIHLNASVITAFLGHEFMMGHFALSTQAGINCYFPFYTKYYEQDGVFAFLERFISTRLGVQYYFFDPDKSLHNLYLGAYIKADFGTADFILTGLGFRF